jgi:hypothetical protein
MSQIREYYSLSRTKNIISQLKVKNTNSYNSNGYRLIKYKIYFYNN